MTGTRQETRVTNGGQDGNGLQNMDKPVKFR